MTEKVYTVIGLRVVDRPEPYVPSDKHICEDCQEAVWVDKQLTKQLPKHKAVCIRCVAKREDFNAENIDSV